jgi:hypothetical protein
MPHMRRLPVIAITVLAAGALACSGGAKTGSNPPPPAAPATTAKAAPPPAPAAGPKTTIDADGTYLVGKDIAPGQYKTTVPAGAASLCLWERLSGTTGDAKEILAQDVGQGGANLTVTILASDKAFKTTGCGKWQKTG